jgi:tetratricopeptide (TPR) repeat protein
VSDEEVQISELQERAERFFVSWNSQTNLPPALVLDGTWPTIGVLDLILTGLRGRKIEEWDAAEQNLFRDVLSAIFVHLEILFEEAQIELTAGLKQELESEIRSLLQNWPKEVFLSDSHSRMLPEEWNFLSPLISACIFGYRFGTEEEKEKRRAKTELLKKILAREISEWFERMFPTRSLSHVAELYLDGMITPPATIDEPYPYLDRMQSFLSCAKELRLTEEKVGALSDLFVQCPDELISNLGTILGAMTLRESPELYRAYETRGGILGLFRPALVVGRFEYYGVSDWIQQPSSSDKNWNEKSKKYYSYERDFGFIPWAMFQEKILTEPLIVQEETGKALKKCQALLEALVLFQFDDAQKNLQELLNDFPSLIELRLQEIFLLMLRRELDQAQQAFQGLLTEPAAERSSRFWSQWGLLALWRNENTEAVRFFENAWKYVDAGTRQQGNLANDLCWALILTEQFDKAQVYARRAIELLPESITPKLNYQFSLRLVGKVEEADKIILECLQIAPLDRRVFRAAML